MSISDLEAEKNALEEVYQIHGPYVAIQFIDTQTTLPDWMVLLSKASICYRTAQFSQAQVYLESIVEFRATIPDDFQPEWYSTQAGIYFQTENHKAMKQVLDEGVQKFPSNITLQNFSAWVNDKLGVQPYEERYTELVQLFGDRYEIKESYADFLFRKGADDLAEPLAKDVLEQDSNNVKALDILGYIALDRTDDAVAYSYFQSRSLGLPSSNCSTQSRYGGPNIRLSLCFATLPQRRLF